MKAVLYLRISVADDESTGIARQRADLLALADKQGWEVVDTLVDDGKSGLKARANADRALDMLRDGTVDVLAVWKLDRWTRMGLTALAQLVEVVEARQGALFWAEQDGLNSEQAAWRLIAGVLTEVARMEAENTRLRVASAIAHLRKGGRYPGGRVPYGYASVKKPDGPGFMLMLNEPEAEVIRYAARQVKAGVSLWQIARTLNEGPVQPRRAERWRPEVLWQVLTGKAILGYSIHHGEPVTGPDGLPVQFWEPVLELSEWQELQPLLERKPISRRKAARLLSGLMKCAHCGGSMNVNSSGSKGGGRRQRHRITYRCGTRSNGGDCIGVSISAEPLEKYVTDTFLEAEGHLHMFTEVRGRDEQAIARLAEAEAMLDTVMTRLRGERDRDVKLELLDEQETIHATIEELRQRAEQPVLKFVQLGESINERWETAGIDERRRILGMALEPMQVRKASKSAHPSERVEVRVRDGWRVPQQFQVAA